MRRKGPRCDGAAVGRAPDPSPNSGRQRVLGAWVTRALGGDVGARWRGTQAVERLMLGSAGCVLCGRGGGVSLGRPVVDARAPWRSGERWEAGLL